jgi:bacteriochlorophyllide a dehydrogenase
MPTTSTRALLIERPHTSQVSDVVIEQGGSRDIVVDIAWSGVSTGTERLLWTGAMPPFPGMGYPLVPGYESVGQVVTAGEDSGHAVGSYVFVPGSRCIRGVRNLFGGAAARLVVPGRRAIALPDPAGDRDVLLALAATARHAIAAGPPPDLIVGHGVLGRLLARLTLLSGGTPVVWEREARRQTCVEGYPVVDPDDDPRTDYSTIVDASGDPAVLDTLIARLALGGEIVLAGFYAKPLAFSFPPAFMREARIRVAAEWKSEDLAAARDLVASGQLTLDGLVTHRAPATEAPSAYRTAFEDASCLKLVLDWRSVA